MAKKLDVYALRDDLMKVAEKEAKKRPDISKEELKKELREYLTQSEIVEKALVGDAEKIVEKVVSAVTELAVKMLELYLREKESRDAAKEKVEASNGKPAKAPAKKAAAKKKK
jgi:hypothetical protein